MTAPSMVRRISQAGSAPSPTFYCSLGASARLVELKFPARWDRDTLRGPIEKLRRQREHYPEVLTVITVIARAHSPGGEQARADDLIRILPERRLELLAAAGLSLQTCADTGTEEEKSEPLWQSLSPLTSTFDVLQRHRPCSEKPVPLIRALGDL